MSLVAAFVKYAGGYADPSASTPPALEASSATAHMPCPVVPRPVALARSFAIPGQGTRERALEVLGSAEEWYPTEDVFLHPIEPLPEKDEATGERPYIKPAVEQLVPLSEIVPTQGHVGPERVRFHHELGEEKLPLLVRKGGRFLVHNGHHRAVARMAEGEALLRARVYELGVDA